MINSNNYCSKLDQLKAVLNEKHPELVSRKLVIFHQDKTRPPVSLMTRQKLLHLGCSSEVLIHVLYNRHCTFGFSLFLSLQNSLYEKIFNSLEVHKKHVEHLFAEKDKSFGKTEL